MKRLSIVVAVVVAMALFTPGISLGAPPQGTVDICHNTGSATNPVVKITVAVNALPPHLAHGDEVIVVVDADGSLTATAGGPADIQVKCGDPLTKFFAGNNGEGLDMFDTDGSGTWTSGDDLHVEDPAKHPGAIRDGLHQDSDPRVLDIDGSLLGPPLEAVSCDLEVGAFCAPTQPGALRFFDSNGNGLWDDGEDIVLDTDGDGILG